MLNSAILVCVSVRQSLSTQLAALLVLLPPPQVDYEVRRRINQERHHRLSCVSHLWEKEIEVNDLVDGP